MVSHPHHTLLAPTLPAASQHTVTHPLLCTLCAVLVGGYVALLVCLLYRTRYKRSFTAPRAVHGRRLEVGVGESRRVEVDASGKGKAAAVPEDDPMDVDDEEEQSGEAEAVDLQHLLSRVNKLKLHEADG